MAERIKSVASRFVYPWQRWMDGSAWRTTQGKDFQCEPEQFRKQIVAHGHRHKIAVRTAVRGKTVEFAFEKP